MKKVSLFILTVFMFVSCKSTIDTKSQVGLKGDWIISKVSYPGAEMFKVSSFGIADSKCFEGSEWNFVSNNNKGTMKLKKSNCTEFSSPIVWSINKDNQFGLKIVEPGAKAKNVLEGYVLKVANQTPESFQLIDKINIGGKQAEITYEFSRVQ
jgi:Lipocalin-like domain